MPWRRRFDEAAAAPVARRRRKSDPGCARGATLRATARRSIGLLAAGVLACLGHGPALAQSDAPPESMIVAMAQHHVQEQFMLGDRGHYHIEFDVAYLHPQPEPGYWAVVGGFISDQSTPNIYVAAVRLICPDWSDVACWRLEKLAINREIVVDRGKPL